VDDAAAVSRLMAQLGYDVSPADAAARLPRILSRSDHRFVVAEDAGVIVGWIHASLSEHIDAETCVLIEGLVVDRDHRGHGVGRRLLGEAEDWARASGCALVRLRSTDARTEAHRFYEHLGYMRVKTQFSFAKAVDPARADLLERLVPRVEQ
jgi:GNAT superfamily N-acetyltransferase